MIYRLLKFAQPHLVPLVLSLLCRVLNQLGTVAILVVAGLYAQKLFDTPSVERLSEHFWSQLICPLLWIGVGKAFCRYIEQLSGHNAAFRIQESLRKHMYWQLESQAPDNIQALSTGDLTAKVVSDIERIEVFYAHTIVPVMSAMIVSLCVTFYGYQIAGGAALVLFGLLLVVGLVIPGWHLYKSKAIGTNLRRDFGRFNATLTDIVGGTGEIQNWHAMPFFQHKVAEQGKQLQTYYHQLAKRNGLKDALTDVVIGLGFLGVVLQVWWLNGEVSLPLLCLYAGAFGPVLALTRTFEDLPQTFPACKRVLSMLDLTSKSELTNKACDIQPTAKSQLLTVDNLSHRYSEDSPWLFKDLSFQLSTDQYVVIQGESGSGKTSLLRYLAAIYISEDTLCLNGLEINKANRLSVWASSCYVPQQTVIFPASLRYNLCLGQSYSDEVLQQALKLVCLDAFFTSLKDGFDTELGLNGSRVSGGEAQRIALARAWLRDTTMYFLDEAFSALDKETERTIRSNLQSHWKGKLVVEVAHQPEGVGSACQHWQLINGQLLS